MLLRVEREPMKPRPGGELTEDQIEDPIYSRSAPRDLRRLRTKAELSRDELVDRADVGHGHISKIERGELLCRVDTLVKLAAALDVTPDDLLAGVHWRRRGDRTGDFELRSPGGRGDAR
jgi:DNA-binding XRE family transcriptional regulator